MPNDSLTIEELIKELQALLEIGRVGRSDPTAFQQVRIRAVTVGDIDGRRGLIFS